MGTLRTLNLTSANDGILIEIKEKKTKNWIDLVELIELDRLVRFFRGFFAANKKWGQPPKDVYRIGIS